MKVSGRWGVTSWGVGSRVLDFRACAQIEPPVEDQADGVEDGEAVHRELRGAGLDLRADHHRRDEGTVGGDGRGPAQHGAGLLAVEDHADGAEGRTAADAAGK